MGSWRVFDYIDYSIWCSKFGLVMVILCYKVDDPGRSPCWKSKSDGSAANTLTDRPETVATMYNFFFSYLYRRNQTIFSLLSLTLFSLTVYLRLGAWICKRLSWAYLSFVLIEWYKEEDTRVYHIGVLKILLNSFVNNPRVTGSEGLGLH